MKPHSLPCTFVVPTVLILVDVEQLGHFVQIRMLFSILDDLRITEMNNYNNQTDILLLMTQSKTAALTFLATGILLNTFHRIIPTTTLSLR